MKRNETKTESIAKRQDLIIPNDFEGSSRHKNVLTEIRTQEVYFCQGHNAKIAIMCISMHWIW